jgi:hypothetical protein
VARVTRKKSSKKRERTDVARYLIKVGQNFKERTIQMNQEQQSREIVEQAERLIAEAEESGKRLRAQLAECVVEADEYFADYNRVRPGILERGRDFAKQMVEEDFPMPKKHEPAPPKFRSMI